MIIGNKNEFAIEFEEVGEKNLAKCRIWLGNIELGYYEDRIYLSYIESALTNILKKDLNVIQFNNLTHFEIYNLIYEKLDSDLEKCKISFGESFDDFLICVYQTEDELTFLWKYVEDPYFKYANYDNDLHIVKVKLEYFKMIYREFMLEFNKIVGVL